jgi:hypothetical protein
VEQRSSTTAGRLGLCWWNVAHSRGERPVAAKLAMNVLEENELIFCVQQIADY